MATHEETTPTLTPEPALQPVQYVLWAMSQYELYDQADSLGIVADVVTGDYATNYESTLDRLRALQHDEMLTEGQRNILKRMYCRGPRAGHRTMLQESVDLSNNFLHAAPGSVLIIDRLADGSDRIKRIANVTIKNDGPEAELQALTDEGDVALASMQELFCRVDALNDLAQKAVRVALQDE